MLDSSALVYLLEGESGSPRRNAVERFLERERSGGPRLAASTIVWTELLERPLAERDEALASRYRGFLADSGRIVLREVDVAVAERAAAIAASLKGASRRKFSGYDLIHIATAIELSAKAVLTNDEAWASVPHCPPLLLVDELAAEE